MATPYSIELSGLLQAISEEHLAGADIRDDPSPSSPFQSIKNARNVARNIERQSIHDGESQEAQSHWKHIAQSVPSITRELSKDLEIACWYTEALIRTEEFGFAGLRDGFALINGLIENFWEPLHPMPDEYGMETRTSCLAGLNGEGAEGVLIAPIRRISLTNGDSPFSLWEYHQAKDAQKVANEDERDERTGKLGFSMADIERSVEESSQAFYCDLRDDIGECISLYKNITHTLDNLCGVQDAPPTRTIIEALEECSGVVNHIARNKFPIKPELNDDHVSCDEDNHATRVIQQIVAQTQGPIASREDAFEKLDEIAQYFLKTEPHSPISYVLQKAVKWGKMPLNELIEELIPDRSSRDFFGQLTGVETEDN